MINTSLLAYADRIRRSERITFADVKRLQRDILPDGIVSRQDAEALIALDQAVGRAHPAWSGYLVTAVVDFVVWGSRPTGFVDADTARWLVQWLSSPEPTKAALLIAREVVREADAVDDTLLSFAKRAPSRSPARRVSVQVEAPAVEAAA